METASSTMVMSESIMKGNFIEGNALDIEAFFAEENKLDEINQINNPNKTKKQTRKPREKKQEVDFCIFA